jgi:hypothetical protein
MPTNPFPDTRYGSTPIGGITLGLLTATLGWALLWQAGHAVGLI